MAPRNSIRVALDWTPNTIHTGLYVAQHKHFYADLNLGVQLSPPDAAYTTTPAKRLESGEVDLAICPSESCIAYHQSGKMKLQAIYALLQKDASAIVSTKYARIAELGGGTYGSYNARYEDHIVRAMVGNDGGNGEKMKVLSEEGKLDIFAAVKKGQIDATWVFLPWEGVEAEMEGVKLNVFRTEEYGVPYGYSPVIARDAASMKIPEGAVKDFVKATQMGYRYAMENVGEAVEILANYCNPQRSKDFLVRSQGRINVFYGERTGLGVMEDEKWDVWVEWLRKQGLLAERGVVANDLFTNEFF